MDRARPGSAWDRLAAYVKERRESGKWPKDFEAFENDLHERLMAVKRDLIAEEFVRADEQADAIEVEGTIYRRVVRCEDTYFTTAGPVRAMRSLYKNRADEHSRSICPMELRLGLIQARWTPAAAKQASWVVSQLTPGVAEELFKRMGNMTPSKATLDRLPKQLHDVWEAERLDFEAALRASDIVPAETATVAVSLDGVLAPMIDGKRAEKRGEAAARGEIAKGPAGYREVGCGTVSMYDAEGELLRVIRMARMPESKKETLKEMLTKELAIVLKERPGVNLVKIADGAKDNWEFLSNALPGGIEVLDFFHAAEHLAAALGNAYGDGSIEARNHFDTKRRILREDPAGVDKVIQSLAYLTKKHPRNVAIARALGYFRTNRSRMRYADIAAQNLPIGSGIVEASCKTLVGQRLKLSGMRWSVDGGQAILNLRAWHQSDRFDRAWALIAAEYKAEITVIANVINLHNELRSARQ